MPVVSSRIRRSAAHDRRFLGRAGVGDQQLEQEPVELRLGQRVGAFLLDRILRRENMERPRQVVTLSGDRHMILLHRLQERRLRARAGAIDLVGEQELRENGPLDEAEGALAARAFLQHLGAENVGRHEVGGELDAARFKAEHDAHGVDELGLGEPGHADQQRMTAGQHRDERLLHHLFLAEDHRPDGGAGGAYAGGRGFGAANNRLIEAFQIIGGGGRHSLLLVPGRDAVRPIQ